MLKNAQTYEIMTPESVGVKSTSLVMGKHSGRARLPREAEGARLRARRERAGGRLQPLQGPRRPQEARLRRGHRGAGRRGDRGRRTTGSRSLSLTVIAGTGGPQKATLTLDIDGRHETREATGNGPVDATFNAIHALVPHEAKLSLYQVHAVTEGTDAQAEVSVRLEPRAASRSRPRRRSRHAGRLGEGLCLGAQQADVEAGPAARAGLAGLISGQSSGRGRAVPLLRSLRLRP